MASDKHQNEFMFSHKTTTRKKFIDIVPTQLPSSFKKHARASTLLFSVGCSHRMGHPGVRDGQERKIVSAGSKPRPFSMY
jgi:hypothetical protein